MQITSYGAAGEVTGSCHLIECGGTRILLDCGLIQGQREDEERNRDPFPFSPDRIDAVILSHAHLDHSGRLPILKKAGFRGPVYTHEASMDLCGVLFKDAGFINEKETEWENKKRQRRGESLLQPLFTMQEARETLPLIEPVAYDKTVSISDNIAFRMLDAGHILGSAIVEVRLKEHGEQRILVYSGDLGHRGAPILRDPTVVKQADVVLMESTYGDRNHRGWEDTFAEIRDIIVSANQSKGNILIPAFAVGRSQELLYLFSKNFDAWELGRWQIFLDSPMAIDATAVYAKHTNLYDKEAAELWNEGRNHPVSNNVHFTKTSEESMKLNDIRSGAIIIAGSGMCTGGRIKHHLKHNIWQRGSHVMIIGFQGKNTLGRQLVDGAEYIKLWGETVKVVADIHTVGGLSAHADQKGLLEWYNHFEHRPPVLLVHGEPDAQQALADQLNGINAETKIMTQAETLNLLAL